MKHLYLVRHAKSSWAESALADFERPLNGRGKRDALLMGRRLAALKRPPDLVVSSPARRARKTALRIAAEIGYQKSGIVLLDELYTFNGDELPGILHGIDDGAGSLMLVGHNEAISEFAGWLLARPFPSVPTCAVVSLGLDRERWKDVGHGDGTLDFYDYPKRPMATEESV